MKIMFLCPAVSRTCGGIFEIERSFAQALARLPQTTLEIFGPSDEHAESDLPAWLPLKPQHFAYVGPSSFRYSPGLRRAVLGVEADVMHLHALWMHNSIILREWVRRWNRPYLITANGMLEPWAIRNSGWKKRIALALHERNCLNGAACLQVNSEAEYRAVREFGLHNPICIIPNGIGLPEDTNLNAEDEQKILPWRNLIPAGHKILFYLGRLHPKKGLVNLLKAWAQLQKTGNPHRTSEWTLVIAGWDQSGHEHELKKLAAKLQLQTSVFFPGPQFQEAKIACYRNCDAFILPSFSEGLPMAVLEAWSHGKPVLMTPQCNLPEGFSADAALRINPDVESIATGLSRLFKMSDNERHGMGQRGLSLVKQRFTWPKVAVQMRAVYEWMLGQAQPPEYVRAN
ncbi:glycosyltransferase [Methylacidiphilales bacterium]|nr:glycosyltransferase [Candidatus Methylacidiphilales bacterium]